MIVLSMMTMMVKIVMDLLILENVKKVMMKILMIV